MSQPPPYTVITLHHPCRLVCLNRAPLPTGKHIFPGDYRLKVRDHRDLRLIQAGVVSVEFVGEESVRADTVSEGITPIIPPQLLVAEGPETQAHTPEDQPPVFTELPKAAVPMSVPATVTIADISPTITPVDMLQVDPPLPQVVAQEPVAPVVEPTPVVEAVEPAPVDEVPVEEQKPCSACGQVNIGQQGEHPCKICGLPTEHDKEKPEEPPVEAGVESQLLEQPRRRRRGAAVAP